MSERMSPSKGPAILEKERDQVNFISLTIRLRKQYEISSLKR